MSGMVLEADGDSAGLVVGGPSAIRNDFIDGQSRKTLNCCAELIRADSGASAFP